MISGCLLYCRVVNEMHSTRTRRKKEWAEKLSYPEVFWMYYDDETMYSNPEVVWMYVEIMCFCVNGDNFMCDCYFSRTKSCVVWMYC
ncbi:hypothetical protein HanRHA438_Chr13g0590431 [Helianthus annuus]|uniref:Uncharacterized protein n=1 Tax=Helianthus annuus TaxID=4232 RepID=A0A9K3EGA0_HELAN|nr:hypothetical protein HanXRQr2_Chr13g0579541 [Helianthus annuus]KAJ0476256.1 hypothetical protein HanHA300_Chr13g0475261 [Helianthus annuus]KAJ0480374.1 hypothetical protein HanIR_Chr13g0630911 [Helianthus annuus]KAJ0497063.1 hypothetical protein HanHA89_Chr13g0507181 [Helianthus annuus]KAJ0663093.1 hypothetical protein HanLR1_Chr13g0477371 [Helianthus annuus]